MSVRPLMAGSHHQSHLPPGHGHLHPFNAYPRRSFPPQPRQFHPPRLSTMPMMQPETTHFASTASDTAAPMPLTLRPGNSVDYGGANDTLFNEFLHLPTEQNDLNFPQWRADPGTNLVAFRPSDSTYGSFGSNFGSSFDANFNDALGEESDGMIKKIDNTPSRLSFTALPHQVDTSKYENIDNSAWPMSSVDYDEASPTSVDTQSNGPDTPISPTAGNVFPRAVSVTSSQSYTISNSGSIAFKNHPTPEQPAHLTGQCQCNRCSLSLTQTAPPNQFMGAYHIPDPRHQSSFNPPMYGLPQGYALPVYSHGGNFTQAVNHLVVPQSNDPTTASLLRDLDQTALDTTPELSDRNEDTEQDDEDDDEPEQVDEPNVNEKAVTEAAHRRDRDQYLLKMREKGLSYKEIKRRGRFREAESTLRGRVRVLTKDKSERVRKPEWTANDLQLLNYAVDRFRDRGTYAEHEGVTRIPWKKISQWMHTRGCSYHFAPATCAKKYREMNN